MGTAAPVMGPPILPRKWEYYFGKSSIGFSGRVIFNQRNDDSISVEVRDFDCCGDEKKISQVALDKITVDWSSATQKGLERNQKPKTTFSEMSQKQRLEILEKLAPNQNAPGWKLDSTNMHDGFNIFDPT
jgi:hypothetical protein